MWRFVLVFTLFASISGCSEGPSQPPAARSTATRGGRGQATSFETKESSPFDAIVAALPAGSDVRFGSLSLAPPKEWKYKPPQSSFVQAEFALPRAGQDVEDGRLTLSLAGGSIKDNVERWKGQFSGQLRAKQEEQTVPSGLTTTVVDLSGDYNDQRGPFAPPVARQGYRMIAVIIPVEGELHFVKAVGPQQTIDARAEEILAFVRTAKKVR